jgi:hypothetical protein
LPRKDPRGGVKSEVIDEGISDDAEGTV